jgi:hypothetical protein
VTATSKWVQFIIEYPVNAADAAILEVLEIARSTGYARVVSVAAPVASPDDDKEWTIDDD